MSLIPFIETLSCAEMPLIAIIASFLLCCAILNRLVVILCVPFSEISVWMLVAYEMNMADGDFAFIFVGANVPSPSLYQNMTRPGFWRQGISSDSHIEKAMQSLLIVSSNLFKQWERYSRCFVA